MVSNVFTLPTTAGSIDDNGNVMAILRDARVTREDASRHSLRHNPEDDQSEPEDDHSDRKALLKMTGGRDDAFALVGALLEDFLYVPDPGR